MTAAELRERARDLALELLPGLDALQQGRRPRLKIAVPSGARYWLTSRRELVRGVGRVTVICNIEGKRRSPLFKEPSETDLAIFVEYDAGFLRDWIADRLGPEGSAGQRHPAPIPGEEELSEQARECARGILKLPGLKFNMRATGPSGTRYRIGRSGHPRCPFTIVALPRTIIYSPAPDIRRMHKHAVPGNLRYFIRDAPALLEAFQTTTGKSRSVHRSTSALHRPDAPTTPDELARRLDPGPVALAQHAPAGNVEAIEIYDQPQPGKPLIDAGPIAVITNGGDRLQLWPVGSRTFDGHRDAWSSLLWECATYFNPKADADANWSYARYHTTTVSNALARTNWVRRLPPLAGPGSG